MHWLLWEQVFQLNHRRVYIAIGIRIANSDKQRTSSGKSVGIGNLVHEYSNQSRAAIQFLPCGSMTTETMTLWMRMDSATLHQFLTMGAKVLHRFTKIHRIISY